MARRTQITLTDDQYERLRGRSEATGSSLAELIRRAVDDTYGDAEPTVEESIEILERTSGAWKDRDFTGAEYVERIRPGLGQRLAKLGL
jgi:predicted DNA-binding protein